MAVRSFPALLTKIEQLTEKVYYYELAAPEGGIDFQAGQFVSLLVAKNIRRSYSIVTAPFDNSRIGMLVDVSPMGPGSVFFLGLRVGMQIQALGPLGNFIYHPEEQRELHFYATGTGVAPLWSMLLHALVTEKTNRKIKLYWGFRYQSELVYVQQLADIKADHSNFEYEIFVSRPNEGWTGRSGYINQDIASYKNPHLDAYICGGNSMIMDTRDKLLSLGVPLSQIYFEKYY